ncbi:MAG: glycosyltransferase family 1 protein, partial [Caldilineae bacterium]
MLVGIDASRAVRARRTGTERYALEIIRHLLALPEAARHTWRLYVDRTPPSGLFPKRTPDASHDNVAVEVLRAPRLWTHTALAWQVIRRRPDVLFVPAHVIPALPPRLLPPSVVTLHDVGYRRFPRAHTWSQRLYLEWSTRWSGRVARRIIAPSQATAGDLAHFYPIPAGKVRVIHEGPTRFDLADAPRPAWLPERPYGLYVGTIQPRKNLGRLIQAYARLQADAPLAWDLVLAGQAGWLSRPLLEEAARWGVADRVHFPGYVSDEELPGLLRHALFFAFPSLFEGFGLPVLEAQHTGAPVMCANNSALPEVAGDAAILVDPEDVDAIAEAMLRLSQDDALRQELIAKGYENV